MMDSFETQSVISEDTFKQLKKYLMPQGQKLALVAFILLAVCLLVVSAFAESYFFMVLMAVAAIVFTVEYLLILNKHVKINIKRMQETVHAKECGYTTSFSDAGFKMKNHVTNAEGTIAYDDIKRFVETKTFYVLFTGANQFGVVNRSDIDGANKKEELINFLKQNCKNIRW